MDYQNVIRDYIWKNSTNGWFSARDVCEEIRNIVSKTTIINYLNELCREGLLVSRTETCRGGKRKVYMLTSKRSNFEKDYSKLHIKELLKNFRRSALMGFLEAIDESDHINKEDIAEFLKGINKKYEMN